MKAKDLFSLLLVVLFLISVGCGGGTGTDSGPSSTDSGGTTGKLLSISVTPGNPSVPAEITGQFTASGTYSDGTTHDITTQVTWTSSDTSVATVNSSGLATAVAAGTTTITATSGSISGNTTFTVNRCNPIFYIGNSRQSERTCGNHQAVYSLWHIF